MNESNNKFHKLLRVTIILTLLVAWFVESRHPGRINPDMIVIAGVIFFSSMFITSLQEVLAYIEERKYSSENGRFEMSKLKNDELDRLELLVWKALVHLSFIPLQFKKEIWQELTVAFCLVMFLLTYARWRYDLSREK